VRVSQPACAATSSARSSARCSGEPKPRRNLCPGLCVCMVSFWSSVSGPFSVDSHRLPSQSYAHCSISVSRRTARAPRGKAAVHASGPLSLLVFPRSPSKTFCFDMFSKTNALQCIEKPWRHKMAFVTEKIIIHVSFIAFASRTCCHCQNLRALEQPRKQCTEMHWPAAARGVVCVRIERLLSVESNHAVLVAVQTSSFFFEFFMRQTAPTRMRTRRMSTSFERETSCQHR